MEGDENMDLDELEISVRAYNCLKRSGINTIEDLCNLTEDDIMRVRNLGRRSFMEVLNVMKDNGLKFKIE
jgi:DNA-directed RNA polymerase subunit alpha